MPVDNNNVQGLLGVNIIILLVAVEKIIVGLKQNMKPYKDTLLIHLVMITF